MEKEEPSRKCGIVLKGGITSGIVYPSLACALAQKFCFARIGGTSAGAIAAAAIAAAECGRKSGGAGFARLEKLPEELRQKTPDGRTYLSALFQPHRTTRSVLHLLEAAQSSRNKIFRLCLSLVSAAPAPAACGALPGVSIVGWVLLLWQRNPLYATLYLLVIGSIVALVGAIATAAVFAGAGAERAIIANFYGVCSGYYDQPEDREHLHAAHQAEPLTEWLANLLNDLSGKSPAVPLTFYDLWGGRARSGSERDIDLQMVATCLTHGRPYRLPFEEENAFYFNIAEWRRLFPGWIVDWMVNHPRPTSGRSAVPEGFCAFPAAPDLPVVVAARMSLSFPILLSAIPLYAIDRSRIVNGGQPKLEKCWFSDGGISSNFPVHLFDDPLPRWPTFAVNMRGFHPDHPYNAEDQSKNIWMIDSNKGGLTAWWNRFDAINPGKKPASLFGFLGVIFDSMQNWNDNVQIRLPGFRDRIVHIMLQDTEGGMNLNMDPDKIAELSERGRCAGSLLCERFTADEEKPDCPLTWDNHRWVRYRSTMACLQEWLAELRDHLTEPPLVSNLRSYDALIKRGSQDPPPSYRSKAADEKKMQQAVADLAALIEHWEQQNVDFAVEAPNPRPALRMMPRI